MDAEEYMTLYEKYISGNCTPEEIKRLYAYQDNFNLMDDQSTDPQLGARLLGRINNSINPPVKKLFNYKRLFKVAAILLLSAGTGFLVYHQKFSGIYKNQGIANAIQKHGPILPGKPSATLTLSDGSVVDLNQIENGMISSSDSLHIIKANKESIRYTGIDKAESAVTGLNTLSVPRGGSFTVSLPDGTKVWMNAASSLTFPVSFTGKTRSVELIGEAYFEVAKNKEKPFIVRAGKSDVRVLGTHFNIKSYEGENTVSTTLLEGSVQFSNPSGQVILVPGEQGQFTQNKTKIEVRKVNTNQVVSWKNGYFMFQDNNIKEIMDQISRWYDVEVEIKGDLSNKTFGGIYSRNKDINELLKGLELTGLVHFKIEGRKITVTQ